MRKFFTFAAALLATLTMSAETVTMDLALAKGSTPAPSIGEALLNGGAFDGNGYKMGSDGQFVGWNIAAAEQTFSAVSFNGYINTTSTDKNWGFQFSTDGGTTWGDELLQANDGSKSYHDIAVTVDIPEGANAIRIIRKAGTSTYVSAITLTLGNATPSTDPVESAEISGENTCMLGASVTLTCTAAHATDYQWYLGGIMIDEANAKTYTFTPEAAGDFTFTCAAWNEYTETPVLSDELTITVVDPASVCGELIKATHVNKNTATVTGVVGGSADKNTQDNGKLGANGHYFGVKLASGNFQAGDEVTIVASVLNGGNTATIYSDKGTTLLGSVDFDAESLTATYMLEDNVEWIYVYRTTSACNPNIEYISVTRSCEASSNANIKSLAINGETIEAVEGVYSYTVGSSVDLAAVEVVYTLAHPKATAAPASGFTINVPAAGADANTQVITVTAQDGTQATYTVSVAKSAEASHDATLSALTVDGYTLSPAFASDVLAYTITKAYGAANPDVLAVSATTTDANAQTPVIAINGDIFTITVTAEDGTTEMEYTITIIEAAAKKALLSATFSNGVHGFILNNNIDVPYLATEAEPAFVSAAFWNADGEPSYELVNGNLVVTGIDGQTDTYTITYVPLTPMEANYEEIVFDGVPSYAYSVYGWDENKGLKFSKDLEEVSNHRISEGKDRIYLALPAAQNITLTSGSGAKRPVEVLINGHIVEMGIKTPAEGATINFPLNPAGPNFIGFESKGNNGDAGFTKIQLEEPFPTAIENSEVEVKAVKVIRNGQLFIEKNGVLYNAQGIVAE